MTPHRSGVESIPFRRVCRCRGIGACIFQLCPYVFHMLECSLFLSFSKTVQARSFNLGIDMYNTLFYGGSKIGAHCAIASPYLSIFCLFKVNLFHSFLKNCIS